MATEKKMRIRRSKEEIDQLLMNAVCKVINEKGFSNLGINTVSEVATVEKAYIYRNFDSFENLLERYFAQHSFWERFILQKVKQEQDRANLQEIVTTYLSEMYKTMDQNEEMESLIRWEVAEPTPYIVDQAKKRESETKELRQKLASYDEANDIDAEAMVSIVLGGLFFLVLHKNIPSFFGIEVTKRDGKKRIHKALERLTEMIFNSGKK